MAMRDEFELSGSQFFSPCSPTEAEVMQLLRACAPAEAHAVVEKPPGSTAVCPGGRGDAQQPASSPRAPEGLEADILADPEASMCRSAGHLQPAASSGADRREADGRAGEGECACSGRGGAAHARHAPLAAPEPDQTPGLTASPGSGPPGTAAAEGSAAVEASSDPLRSAGAGMDCVPQGTGAAGLSAGQSLPEASACGRLEQGPQHGEGLCTGAGKPAVGTDQGDGRRHAPLRWAEAGYLPANPLVRTAAGALAHVHAWKEHKENQLNVFYALSLHGCCATAHEDKTGKQHHGALAYGLWTSTAGHV